MVAQCDLDIGILPDRCRRVIDVLSDAMIGETGHGLVDVTPGRGRDHRQHLSRCQAAHQAPAIERGRGEGRHRLRDLALHQDQIVMRPRAFPLRDITLKG